MTRYAPYCALPWQQMIIDVNGNVGCCGGMGNNRSLGNLKNRTIMEVWNGEEYRDLRSRLSKGDKAGAGCNDCIAEQQNILPDLYYPEKPLGGYVDCDFSRNMELLREDYRLGHDYLEAKPSVISYSGTYICNYKCVMCYQESSRHSRLIIKDQAIASKVLKELQDIHSCLSQLIWGGGEPFLQKECLEFIRSFKPEENPYLCFAVTTNGSLINETILSELRKFHEVILNFSIDAGSREIYEAIRINGKWDNIMENLARAVRIRYERNRWQVTWNFTAMKGNVKEIPKAMQLAADFGIPITVNPIVSHPIPYLLSCFNNYEEDTKGWAHALSEAAVLSLSIDYIKKTGCYNQYQINRLTEMHEKATPSLIPLVLSGRISGLHVRHCLTYSDLIIVYCDALSGDPRWYAKLNSDGSFAMQVSEGFYEVRIYLRINDLDVRYLYWSKIYVKETKSYKGSLTENACGIHNFCNAYSKAERFVCRVFRKVGRINRLFRAIHFSCLPKQLDITHQISGKDTKV